MLYQLWLTFPRTVCGHWKGGLWHLSGPQETPLLEKADTQKVSEPESKVRYYFANRVIQTYHACISF